MIAAMVGFMPWQDRRLSMAIRSGKAANVVPNPATKPMISSSDIDKFNMQPLRPYQRRETHGVEPTRNRTPVSSRLTPQISAPSSFIKISLIGIWPDEYMCKKEGAILLKLTGPISQ